MKGREDPRYAGVSRTVNQMLQIEPELDWARSAGLSISAAGDASEIRARLMVGEREGWTVLEAAVGGDRWWEPETSDHFILLARRLAAELRMKWDRWNLDGR